MRNYRFFKSEHGGAMVMVALMMTVLLGLTAIVVDAGRLYSEKSSLQKALDAAVLAGGHMMLNNPSQAKNIAIEIASKNGYTLLDSDLEMTGASLRATKEIAVPMTFAKVLGINEVDVNATAKVMAGPLKMGRGIAPIAVLKDEIPNGTSLKCQNTGQHSGNCGYLNLDGGGASALANAIKYGSSYSVGDDFNVDTSPGEKWGQVSNAIDYLIQKDSDKPHCHAFATADNSCARVIYVAVIDSLTDASGRSTVEIVGFAAYWLENTSGNGNGNGNNNGNGNREIKGHFIDMVAQGEIDESGTGIGFGLYGLKLVD